MFEYTNTMDYLDFFFPVEQSCFEHAALFTSQNRLLPDLEQEKTSAALPMSNASAGHQKRHANPAETSGSWSDMSDSEFSLPYSVNYVDSPSRQNAHSRLGRSDSQSQWCAVHPDGNMSDDPLSIEPISNPDPATIDSTQQGDEDIAERLTKSLDLGHGSFGYSGTELFSGLQDEDQWDSLEDSPRQAQSLPRRSNQRYLRYKEESVKTETDQADKIKSKMMSAWNNMRHGWMVKMKTSFRYDSPIWLLGRCYHISSQEKEEKKNLIMKHGPTVQVMTGMDRFKHDFTSQLWFTYRRDFPPIEGTQITSDVGWGCMLRSGQMMIAHALVMHFLSRDWRWHRQQKKHEIIYHHQILRFFGDLNSQHCPFSLQRLVKIGIDMGKKPGDWYGPASVAYVLRDAMEQAPDHNPILGQLCLYVAQDCTVYKQDVIDLVTQAWPNSRQNSTRSSTCSTSSVDAQNVETSDDHWRPVIILIPVRLGGESFNPVYMSCIQAILAHDMCLGIIGGKPKHSVYFMGWQEDKIIYLDPHFCQDNVNVNQRDFSVNTFHCMSPRKMSFTKMDPSCTIGFFCKTRLDFENFVHEASKMCAPQKDKGQYPMFVFSEGRSCDVLYTETNPDTYVRVRRVDERGVLKQPSKESDDYVFL